MLPNDFKWKPRWQYDTADNAVYCRSKMVASMDQRIDGIWVAKLGEAHHRTCTTRESGRAGCEAWVKRHEARLRALSNDYEAQLPMRPWMPRSIVINGGTGGQANTALCDVLH
jgi:hypothetical protein